jgi:predicted metal-dependent hydrolase
VRFFIYFFHRIIIILLMENNYEIKYTDTRHGYARIDKEWKLIISIPTFLRNDKIFHENLISKWQKLISRYNKRTHIDTITQDQILLFWESTEKKELWKNTKEIHKQLKIILYEYCEPILRSFSSIIWKKYSELKIKKMKSKWGSCSSVQVIVLNQDLVHLPNKFIRYVIIHEACHLKHKHHQKSFRDLVENLCPNYKLLRRELKNIVVR